MKKPKDFDLKVFGKNIPVAFTGEPIIVNNSYCLGVYRNSNDNESILVYYDDKTKQSDLVVTLLHELGHAVLYRLGFENTDLTNNLHELIVDNIAKCISENWDFEL